MLAYLYIFIAVIIIASIVISVATQAIMNNYKVIEAQRNVYKTIVWKNALIQNSKYISITGLPALPLGTDLTNYHTVPTWVFPETKNIYGLNYVYCPYGAVSTGTLASTIKTSPTTSYNVRIQSDYSTAVNGILRPYVVASSPPVNNYDVLAFIISPFNTKAGNLPSCNNITFDTENQRYITENGYVESITKYDIEIYQKISGTNPNSSYYENQIEGDNSTTNNTLQNNLSYAANSGSSNRTKLILPSGSSNIDNLFFGYSNSTTNTNINENLSKKELIIQGQPDKSSIITATALKKLTFYNYKVLLKDVTISSNVSLEFINADLVTQGSAIKKLNLLNKSTLYVPRSNTLNSDFIAVDNSSINLDVSSILNISGSNGLLYMVNSNLSGAGAGLNLNNTNFNAPVQLTDSTISLRDSSVVNYTATAIHGYAFFLYETGNIVLKDSSLNISGYATNGFGIKGNMTLKDSFVTTTSSGMTNLFLLLRNGALTIDNTSNKSYGNSIVANRPTYNVVDQGGKFISGSNAVLTAKTNCWANSLTSEITSVNLFIASPTGVNGANSKPTEANMTISGTSALGVAVTTTPSWMAKWPLNINQTSWTCQI